MVSSRRADHSFMSAPSPIQGPPGSRRCTLCVEDVVVSEAVHFALPKHRLLAATTVDEKKQIYRETRWWICTRCTFIGDSRHSIDKHFKECRVNTGNWELLEVSEQKKKRMVRASHTPPPSRPRPKQQKKEEEEETDEEDEEEKTEEEAAVLLSSTPLKKRLSRTPTQVLPDSQIQIDSDGVCHVTVNKHPIDKDVLIIGEPKFLPIQLRKGGIQSQEVVKLMVLGTMTGSELFQELIKKKIVPQSGGGTIVVYNSQINEIGQFIGNKTLLEQKLFGYSNTLVVLKAFSVE